MHFLKAWAPVCVSVPYGPQSRHTKAHCLDSWRRGLPGVYSSNNVKAEKQATVCQSSWHFEFHQLSQSIATCSLSLWFKYFFFFLNPKAHCLNCSVCICKNVKCFFVNFVPLSRLPMAIKKMLLLQAGYFCLWRCYLFKFYVMLFFFIF